jgi:hypothetical protein
LEELGATASAVVSFSDRLEDDSSKFYERLADSYPVQKELFLLFAREAKKNKILVTRTYQETVTDALETGYSFKGLVLSDFLPHISWQEGMSLLQALETATTLEKKATEFYLDIAERSRTLLSTIPSAFKKIAENRKSRLAKLEALKAQQ